MHYTCSWLLGHPKRRMDAWLTNTYSCVATAAILQVCRCLQLSACVYEPTSICIVYMCNCGVANQKEDEKNVDDTVEIRPTIRTWTTNKPNYLAMRLLRNNGVCSYLLSKLFNVLDVTKDMKELWRMCESISNLNIQMTFDDHRCCHLRCIYSTADSSLD